MLIFYHNVKLCKFVGYNSGNVVIGARIPSASLQGGLKCGYPAHSWQPCIALSVFTPGAKLPRQCRRYCASSLVAILYGRVPDLCRHAAQCLPRRWPSQCVIASGKTFFRMTAGQLTRNQVMSRPTPMTVIDTRYRRFPTMAWPW